LVGAVNGVPIFGNAVHTEGTLYLDNGGLFNSFDSDVGAYSAGTADSAASLRSNVDISVVQTNVKGDATATGTVTLGASGYVRGTTTQGAPALAPMDILTCPAGGYTPTAKVPTGAGISYSSVSGVLTVSGGNTITLTDTTYFFRAIVLSGNAKLVFPGSPPVNVVIRDSLNATNGIVTNSSNKAANLSFSSCGTSPTPAYWALSSGGSSAYYTVYAPNHIVYELGAGDFYGAIVASIYYATGGGRFHYDAALARLQSNKLAVQRGSWAQLPGS
jgi:hypothetical protein